MKYMSNPGIPPGIKAKRKNKRNQVGLIPKNCPKPPHTPATTLFDFERRKTFLFIGKTPFTHNLRTDE
jgi:hypothetical protein